MVTITLVQKANKQKQTTTTTNVYYNHNHNYIGGPHVTNILVPKEPCVRYHNDRNYISLKRGKCDLQGHDHNYVSFK